MIKYLVARDEQLQQAEKKPLQFTMESLCQAYLEQEQQLTLAIGKAANATTIKLREVTAERTQLWRG